MKRREEKTQPSQCLPLAVSLWWISNPQWKCLVIFLGTQLVICFLEQEGRIVTETTGEEGSEEEEREEKRRENEGGK